MADIFAGSHIKPDAMYGQNGSDTPSSIHPGDNIKRSKIAKGIIAADPVTDGAGDWQMRTISAAPIKAHPGTKGPSTGARVPLSTVRRANDAIIRPTRR